MVPTVREVGDEQLVDGRDPSQSARRAAWGRFRPFAKWAMSCLGKVATLRQVGDELFVEGSDRSQSGRRAVWGWPFPLADGEDAGLATLDAGRVVNWRVD